MLPRCLNRRHEVAGNLGLQNISTNSGIKGARNDVGRVMLGEHEKFGLGKGLVNQPCSTDPVKFRHTDIKNDNFRYQVHGLFEGLAAVRGLTDHVPARMRFEEVPQSVAHPLVVVSNQDRHHSNQADEILSKRLLGCSDGSTRAQDFGDGQLAER